MTGRHHVPAKQRAWLADRAVELADAVPPNMVEGLRYMLQVSKEAKLAIEDAYASITEALRAMQAPHKPHSKAWLVLEAGCLWLERERKKEAAT